MGRFSKRPSDCGLFPLKQIALFLLDCCSQESNECDHQFESERKSSRKVDHCMYELAMPIGFALVWLGSALADQKPKPRPTSLPTCARPAEKECPSTGQTKGGKKRR